MSPSPAPSAKATEYTDDHLIQTDNGVKVFHAIGDANKPIATAELCGHRDLRGFIESDIRQGVDWALRQGWIVEVQQGVFELSERGKGRYCPPRLPVWEPGITKARTVTR